MVGERAAGLSGTLSACVRLAERTGARLAWVPRRAGDRGAVEAGCLPNLLPGGRPLADAAARVDTQTTWGVDSLPSLEGRDADEMLISAADGELAALVVAGIDPERLHRSEVRAGRAGGRRLRDQPGDPGLAGHRARRRGLPGVADAPAGRQLRELGGPGPLVPGRHHEPNGMSDLRVLAALADGLGVDLGFRTAAQARAELDELGAWEGDRAPPTYADCEPGQASRPESGRCRARDLADCQLDDSRALDGEPYLRATAPAGRPGRPGHGGRGRDLRSGGDRHRPRIAAPCPWSWNPPWSRASSGCRAGRRGSGSARHLAAAAGDLVTIEPRRTGGDAVMPLDLEVFMNDLWWVVLLKALFAFVLLLVLTLFTIWYERRVVAFMQHRKGPNMNGPFGLLQSLADGMKLMFKEDFTPTAADKLVFMLAPFVVAVPAITAFAVIPIAGEVRVPFTDIIDAAPGHRSPGVGAVHRGDRLDRGLRHRARRLVVRLHVRAARRPALQRPGDQLRGRDGPGPGRGLPLRRVTVHLGDREPAGRSRRPSSAYRCGSPCSSSRRS